MEEGGRHGQYVCLSQDQAVWVRAQGMLCSWARDCTEGRTGVNSHDVRLADFIFCEK